jgi:hypothetical protein
MLRAVARNAPVAYRGDMPINVGQHLVDPSSPLYPSPVYEDRVYIVAQQTQRARQRGTLIAQATVEGSTALARSSGSHIARGGQHDS